MAEKQAEQGGQDQDGDTPQAAGRARVRDLLIAGLAGWDRPRRMTAAEFERMQDRLVERLAYLSPAALAGLVDLIQSRGVAGLRPGAVPRWPDQGVIEAWAVAMEPRPAFDHASYAASILRSRMGQDARAGGYVVELYRMCLRHGPPPQAYVLAKLRDAGREAARRRQFMVERPDRAGDEDHRWWAAYEADLKNAMALVEAGQAARGAGKGVAA